MYGCERYSARVLLQLCHCTLSIQNATAALMTGGIEHNAYHPRDVSLEVSKDGFKGLCGLVD
jgi:hypothetical protein